MGTISALEYESKLQALEAENEHLKKLLYKSLPPNSRETSTINVNRNKAFEDIDLSIGDVKQGLNEAFEVIAEEYNVDRVSLLHFEKDQQLLVQYSYWSSDSNTEMLFFEPDESVQIISELAQKGYLKGNYDNKTRMWEGRLVETGALSWILVALPNANFTNGILLLESNTFKRDWFSFELAQLQECIAKLSLLMDSLIANGNQHQNANLQKAFMGILEDLTKDNLLYSFEKLAVALDLIGLAYVKNDQQLVSWGNSVNYFSLQQIKLLVEAEKESIKKDKYFIHKENLGGSFVLFPNQEAGFSLDTYIIYFIDNEKLQHINDILSYLNVFGQQIGGVIHKVALDEKAMSDKINLEKSIKQIAQKKQFFESIADIVQLGVIVTNEAGETLYVNEFVQQMLGYHKVDILQQHIHGLFVKNEDFVNHLLADLIKDDYCGEFDLLKKDGEAMQVELYAKTIFFEGDNCCLITFKDISKRKANEDLLSKSENEFKSLTEDSPNVILRINNYGKVLYYNQAFLREFPFLRGQKILQKDFVELNILDPLVADTWHAKIEDVYTSGMKQSMEMGFSNEVNEIYFDWTFVPQQGDDEQVKSILAYGKNLTPRKLAEKQLEVAKDKAEESEKLKTAFLANMSHELRTPLNAIVGFSSLLKENGVDTEDRNQYIDLILKNSDNLMTLINNIMDVAKVESGKISITKEVVNIDAMVTSIYDSIKGEVAKQHRGRVKACLAKPAGEEFTILSDSIRLNQVFNHLINNAVKFTVKGFIEIGYELVDDQVKFFVKDTGIGISDAKQKIIFEPFRQEEENTSQYYGGTGIGLALCDKIVNALGGNIGLNSEKHVGSEFFFMIPLQQEEKIVKEAVKVENRIITISEPIVPKNYHWPNKLILLVDENSSAHLEMRNHIEKTGLTLVSARTATGASHLLKNRGDIHLVMMDLKFSDYNGIELLKAIKAYNKNLPVIAYTPEAVNGRRAELLNDGFDKCVAKPASKDELLDAMNDFLAKEKFI